MSPARRNDLLMVAAGALVVVLDQLTKHWIAQHLTVDGNPIPIFGQVLELDYVQNTGVAFSMLSGNAVLFLFVAVAICVIGWMYWRMRENGSLLLKLSFGLSVIGWMYWRMRENGSLLLKLSFGLILGGAVGNNLIDRVAHGYVVDFIHFQIPPNIFNFAVFNVADMSISIGVVLLAFLLWRGESQMLIHQPPTDAPSASGDAAPVDTSTDATTASPAEVAPRVRRRVASGR